MLFCRFFYTCSKKMTQVEIYLCKVKNKTLENIFSICVYKLPFRYLPKIFESCKFTKKIFSLSTKYGATYQYRRFT